MTDNEIIKALECCSSFDKECKGCPLERMFACYCINYNCKYALDLINRLQEENKRLSNFVTEERCREIAREMIPKFVGQAKAEAYKECIGKAKKELAPIAANVPDMCEILDNLLKELVGE